jgi:hypothetical protein
VELVRAWLIQRGGKEVIFDPQSLELALGWLIPRSWRNIVGGDLVEGLNGDFFNHKSSLVKSPDMMIPLTAVYLFGVLNRFWCEDSIQVMSFDELFF